MKRFEKHIFVCENKRPDGHLRGCCHSKESAKIKELLKEKIKTLGLSPKVRVNSAGCLDACEYGPVIVIYPEQVWYGGVKPENVDEIINSHIIVGEPVENLTIKDPRFNL